MVTKIRKKTTSTVAAKDATKEVKSVNGTKKPVISEEKFAEFVQKRAYYIWEESGRPQNADFDIWIKAEQDIRSKYSVK